MARVNYVLHYTCELYQKVTCMPVGMKSEVLSKSLAVVSDLIALWFKLQIDRGLRVRNFYRSNFSDVTMLVSLV